MGFFTQKSKILPQNALIGELDGNGNMVWADADYDHAWSMYVVGILENRGTRMVNGIHYSLFYLPPPAHNYHAE